MQILYTCLLYHSIVRSCEGRRETCPCDIVVDRDLVRYTTVLLNQSLQLLGGLHVVVARGKELWIYAHKALKLLTSVAAALGHPLFRLISVTACIIVELKLRVQQLTVCMMVLIAFGTICVCGNDCHFALVSDEPD